MSEIDDILFSPVQSWRQLAKEVTDYILKNGQTIKPMRQIYDLDRAQPAGAISLEKLMELYYVNGQTDFYYVIKYTGHSELDKLTFAGMLFFGKYEAGDFPHLGCVGKKQKWRSIRDLNLVPNTYTRHFVFANKADAQLYERDNS